MSARGDMRKIIRRATKRGWRRVDVPGQGARHYAFEWTNGARVTVSASPSCPRAIKNAEADMRRVERKALDDTGE